MPIVTLREYTYWNGKQRRPGDEIDVPQAIADRWTRVGIAGTDLRTAEQALGDMKVVELKRMAREIGVEGYSDMDKATLIEAIRNKQHENATRTGTPQTVTPTTSQQTPSPTPTPAPAPAPAPEPAPEPAPAPETEGTDSPEGTDTPAQ